MSFNRNLEEAKMMLLINVGKERTSTGSIKDIWDEIEEITVQISTTTVNKLVDNIRYTEINYLGVVKSLKELRRGNYRLRDKSGLYEVLYIKKIGPRTILRFKLLEGDNFAGQQRI